MHLMNDQLHFQITRQTKFPRDSLVDHVLIFLFVFWEGGSPNFVSCREDLTLLLSYCLEVSMRNKRSVVDI